MREPSWRDLVPSRKGWESVRLTVLGVLIIVLTEVIGGTLGFWAMTLIALGGCWALAHADDSLRLARNHADRALDVAISISDSWLREKTSEARKEASWRN